MGILTWSLTHTSSVSHGFLSMYAVWALNWQYRFGITILLHVLQTVDLPLCILYIVYVLGLDEIINMMTVTQDLGKDIHLEVH